MEWLQEIGAGVVVGLAGTVLTAVGLGWRILRGVHEEIGKLGETLRLEIAKVGGDVEKLRLETRRETEKLRLETGRRTEKLRQESREAHENIGAQIAEMREGLGEIRGELRGVTSSIDTLREDFRAHVLGSAAG